VAGKPLITFIVAYECPHCQAPLEGRTTRADAWMKCPKCGRASQPPDHAVNPLDQPPVPRDELLVIGPDPEPKPMTPVAVATVTPAPAVPDPASTLVETPAPGSPASPWRVGYASLLFLSVTLLVFSVLEQSPVGMSVFSLGALLFFLLLAAPRRS
jgi:hypothetical protein